MSYAFTFSLLYFFQFVWRDGYFRQNIIQSLRVVDGFQQCNESSQSLHVEAEVHDVAVLHDVVLALDTHLASFTHGGL